VPALAPAAPALALGVAANGKESAAFRSCEKCAATQHQSLP